MEHGEESKKQVLVTGVTGYIGGRLVPRLLAEGYSVRVMVRGGAERLHGRPWYPDVQIAVADVLQPGTLSAALQGIDAAYYMIHSMTGNEKFHERDLTAARNFGDAAAAAGVRQIIYLGGLGDPESELSDHLRSRQQTGAALAEAGVPVTEFRAGMVVGSGSLSFEMLRNLTERVPIMIAPKWVYTKTQPIGIRDILNYLVTALETAESSGRIIEIGGADQDTNATLMQKYAAIRGLRRVMLPVPFLSPRLSSYWVHWVTPVPATLARPLIEGLRNELVVRDNSAREIFPEIKPMDYETAVRLALKRIEEGRIETLWADAQASSQGDRKPVLLKQEQGMLIERRQLLVDAPAAAVFRAFTGLGGQRGWPPFTWLWQLRGLLDRLVGGVGMRRGRRHPDDLRVGEALDFWRVEKIIPDRLLRLRAEMKLPGRGWLQYEAVPEKDGRTQLIQTAYLAPKGLFGFLYWYGIYPLHGIVFSRLINAVGDRAKKIARNAN
jgi:uncharacterized protein YbjT (DUF2867 family)